jgi:hypothetical protein
MEDVLEVYQRPHDPKRPLVCLDEQSKQLIREVSPARLMKPGLPARVDYEYERNGTANLFMVFAPLEGWRRVKVTDRRTAIDYANLLKEVANIHFSDAILGGTDHPPCNRGLPGLTQARHHPRLWLECLS